VPVGFGGFVNGGEDGVEFACFQNQGIHFSNGNAAALDQEFKPIARFFDLLEAVADLGDEFRLAAAREASRLLAPMDVPERRTCLPKTCATVLPLGKALNRRMIRRENAFVRTFKSQDPGSIGFMQTPFPQPLSLST
jgi:hypothetical protein